MRKGRRRHTGELAGKNKEEQAQVGSANRSHQHCDSLLSRDCQTGSARNERKNILFRFINLKMKPACREGDSSSQSVIVEPHAPDTGTHLSRRL